MSLIDHLEAFEQLAASDALGARINNTRVEIWIRRYERFIYVFNINTLLHNFIITSKWINDLPPLAVLTNKIFQNTTLSYPVNISGELKLCLIGDIQSYQTSKIMYLDHPLIPKHVKIVANGRVHYLIDYTTEFQSLVHVYDYLSKDEKTKYATEIRDFFQFAHDQGFIVGNSFYIDDSKKLVFIPSVLSKRCRGDEVVISNGSDSEINDDWQWYADFFRDIDLTKLPAVIKYEGKFTEYSLPDITATEDEVKKAIELIRIDEQGGYCRLEIICALLSKNLPLNNYEQTFLDNLDKFSYARTPIDFYLNLETEQIRDLTPEVIHQYQKLYDKVKTREVKSSRLWENRPGVFYGNETYTFDPPTKSVVYQLLKRSGGKSLEHFQKPSYLEETSLEGISQLLYGTPVSALSTFKGKETFSWFTPEDQKLITRYLQGEIMFYLVYKNLSSEAYKHLSAKGTFLDLYDFNPIRVVIDTSFVKGKNFIDQMRDNVGRLEECAEKYKVDISGLLAAIGHTQGQ